MIKQLVYYKIESIINNAPSVIRIGTAVWPLRIISIILAPFFVIAGALILIIALMALEKLENEFQNQSSEVINELKLLSLIGVVGGVGMILAGLLFIIVAWLSKLVQNRNLFIVETEQVLESIKLDLQAEEDISKSNK
jgi:hypothetical protein